MPLSRERIGEIAASYFADDIIIQDYMLEWSEQQMEQFFESGGISSLTAQPRAIAKPVRFLCLHGGGGNTTINRLQMGRIHKAMGGDREASFEYFQGTRMTPPDEVDPMLRKMFGSGPFFNWYGVENDAGVKSGTDQYSQALNDPSISFKYLDADAVLERLENHIEEHGPYDVLAGFSQGTIVITMLTARRLEQATRGLAPPPSWRLNLIMSGMPPRGNGCPACAIPE
eukprot:CAMPEP_0119323928 /NCGR_PEP_ID=MMETSP1333-20130426/61962_1 /TAXON_ID=418940 /ORGANISM="Scyphosphaera apsteinii, Strain RCC1455" /LENGTH=227 /DNA_ID=CAMNT_0007331499 /DNA_START=60 /DNA_END=740 /DNA_ORIENTATION=-